MKFKSFMSQNKKSWKEIVMSLFTIRAFADGETPPTPASKPEVNIETLLAQARKEEKEKLYPEIERLKNENSLLTRQHNETLLEKGKIQQELDTLKAKKEAGESEEIEKLKAQIEALQEENKKLKESALNEEEIRKQIESEFEVKDYVREKLAENKGKILSTYAKRVTGKTKEEVDEAIKKAIEKSDAIRAEVLGDKKDDKKDDNKPEEKGGKKDDAPPPQKPPANNPSVSYGGKSYSLDYIQGLDPSSEEYKKFREEVGLGRKRTRV